MADPNKADAVNEEQGAVAQPSASTPAPATAAAPVAAPQKGLHESLLKAEEKIFRKHVAQFLSEAEIFDNPIARLNECREILSIFEEGACPDLKEQLEEQISKEEAKLAKLVENTVSIQKDLDLDVITLKENAERITAQGLILNEQVTDYKELCEALQARNRRLLEDNKKLTASLKMKDHITEKTQTLGTKRLAKVATEVDTLKETVVALEAKNDRLMEKIARLNAGNKTLEKTSGRTETKLREAVKLLKAAREASDVDAKQQSLLKAKNKKLQEELQETLRCYEAQGSRYKKLEESHKALEAEIAANDPTTHMLPKTSERVGKFLNLREDKGAGVEEYWADLVDQYGDNVKLFENKIRSSKTLQEATGQFLKYRTQIDPDFAIAAPVEGYAFRNQAERQHVLESNGAGGWREGRDNATTDQINADFIARMKAAGLN